MSIKSFSTWASVAGAEKEQRWKAEKLKDGLAECEEEREYLFFWESLVSSLSTTGARNLRKFGTEEEECNLALKPLSPDGLRDRAWEKRERERGHRVKRVKQSVTVMYSLIGLKQHKSEIYPVLVKLKSAWNGSCDRLFFSTVTYIRVKRHLKWEGGTWFRPSGIDWLVWSWGVTNKMEADLKCQFTDSGGGFLPTGFTANTQAWINVLFIRDDDHYQRHKTSLNSPIAREKERERERESAWMTERVLHQVKSYSWNKLVCDVLRVMLL